MTSAKESNRTSDVLVAGAGIAGLMAAQALQKQGVSVMVVDKGRGVGGRMATWRLGPGRADTGAQFFTVRTDRFQEFVDEWLAEGLLFEWSRGWPDGSMDSEDDGHPRYAAHNGMTAVAKQLAASMPVHQATRLVSVTPTADGWQATAESGATYQSQALILTPPVPQSLALLDAGDVALQEADRSALARIQYAPCISGLFWIDGEVNLPAPGALQRPEHDIRWLADNQRKGISPQAKIVTMHVHPEKSQLWWHAPNEEIEGGLRRELRPFLSDDAAEKEVHIHRWRYALPTVLHPERTLLAQDLPPLVFAGDAFNGPRVEGAALSGLAAADAILPLFT